MHHLRSISGARASFQPRSFVKSISSALPHLINEAQEMLPLALLPACMPALKHTVIPCCAGGGRHGDGEGGAAGGWAQGDCHHGGWAHQAHCVSQRPGCRAAVAAPGADVPVKPEPPAHDRLPPVHAHTVCALHCSGPCCPSDAVAELAFSSDHRLICCRMHAAAVVGPMQKHHMLSDW